MLRVDLGAGPDPLQGFESLDIRPLDGVKYVSDVRKLPFEDGEVDELAARHLIEHFTKYEVGDVLKEWCRVLKPGAHITLWCPNLLYIVEEYMKLPNLAENSERKFNLVGWLYGGQDYDYNFHYFAYDWWLLSESLVKAGFSKVDLLSDVKAQNLCVRAMKPIKLAVKDSFSRVDRPPKILVESTARVFGDSLLSYPLTAIFKAKYPGCETSYAAGKIETPLFECADTIDNVTEKTVDNPSVPLNDSKYDIILRGAFDVDEKWKPEKYIEGFDGPDGWDKVEQMGHRLNFNYPLEKRAEIENKLKPYEGKKKVMMFIPSKRDNMSIPWEISGWDVEKYQEVVNILNEKRDDLAFFTFYGFQEKHDKTVVGPNVVDLGKMYAYDEVLWFQNVDLLISTSTAVSAMIAPLVETPQIVIHTCEEDGTPVWHGIPDKCVLPPLRFLYMNSHKTTGEVISFIKPEPGESNYTWSFNNYFEGKIIPRQMRQSHNINPQVVADEVICRLDNPNAPGKEWFMPKGEKVCVSCELKKKYGKCIYSFEPRLKNGKILGEETDSVRLEPQSIKPMVRSENSLPVTSE
jgi:Methyltransferase domain